MLIPFMILMFEFEYSKTGHKNGVARFLDSIEILISAQ